MELVRVSHCDELTGRIIILNAQEHSTKNGVVVKKLKSLCKGKVVRIDNNKSCICIMIRAAMSISPILLYNSMKITPRRRDRGIVQ
eukprot:scaffold7152_cov148-Skeletonema_dohrnii-CCMP3373.AAC.2